GERRWCLRVARHFVPGRAVPVRGAGAGTASCPVLRSPARLRAVHFRISHLSSVPSALSALLLPRFACRPRRREAIGSGRNPREPTLGKGGRKRWRWVGTVHL